MFVRRHDSPGAVTAMRRRRQQKGIKGIKGINEWGLLLATFCGSQRCLFALLIPCPPDPFNSLQRFNTVTMIGLKFASLFGLAIIFALSVTVEAADATSRSAEDKMHPGVRGLAVQGEKVNICHIPPADPSNFHTIMISTNAKAAHMAHGDLEGSCNKHCMKLCPCLEAEASDCEEVGCPTCNPSESPSDVPSEHPSESPSESPSNVPSIIPSEIPSASSSMIVITSDFSTTPNDAMLYGDVVIVDGECVLTPNAYGNRGALLLGGTLTPTVFKARWDYRV